MTHPPINHQQPQGRIVVVPLGDMDQVAVRVAAATLQAVLECPTDLEPPWPVPDYALITARQQYNAAPIIQTLTRAFDRSVLRIGLMEKDLCLPFLTYVFGEAQVGGLAAVVSLFRLQKSRAGALVPRSLVYERLSKVVLHEIGHLLQLTHCSEGKCLMAFSYGLDQLDSLNPTFCPQCEHLIMTRIRQPFPIG